VTSEIIILAAFAMAIERALVVLRSRVV